MSKDLKDPIAQRIVSAKKGEVFSINRNISFGAILRFVPHLAVPVPRTHSFAPAGPSLGPHTNVPGPATLLFTRTVAVRQQINHYKSFTGNFSAVGVLGTDTALAIDTTGTFVPTLTVVASP